MPFDAPAPLSKTLARSEAKRDRHDENALLTAHHPSCHVDRHALHRGPACCRHWPPGLRPYCLCLNYWWRQTSNRCLA